MPALQPLILVIKGFLSQRGLNNAAESGLSSYALICMCISFLQVRLPCFYSIIIHITLDWLRNDCITKLNPSKRPTEFITKPRETESLGALLTDFMFYYGVNFPYSTSYISVTNGKLLPKASADWINTKIPDRLAIQCLVHSGMCYVSTRPSCDSFRSGLVVTINIDALTLCVENDVGKSAGRIDAIRSAFKKGYATILQLSAEDTNTLGSLVSLPQSVRVVPIATLPNHHPS